MLQAFAKQLGLALEMFDHNFACESFPGGCTGLIPSYLHCQHD